MRLYSTDNTQNAGIVVNYSVLPDEGMANTPYVVVHHMGVDDQGNHILYGWSEGKEYTATIIDGTRLIERKPNFSNSQYTEDTRLNYQNIDDASLIKAYDASTIAALMNAAGSSVPIGIDTLKPGDIVIVGKNGGSEVCYVEMAMRAKDGVMLITSSQASYYARMSGADYLGKGVVSEITEENEFLVDIVGEYNSANRRQVSLPENYRYTLFFSDKKVPYAFENAGKVWIYDYEKGTAELINSSAIKEGDTVMIRGSAAKPKDCIVLKNYPW